MLQYCMHCLYWGSSPGRQLSATTVYC